MKKHLRLAFAITAVASACAALLAACGGGGGGGQTSMTPTDPLIAGTDVPTSATQSASGAFTFVSSVAATSSDSSDPLVLGDATLATSETDDPQPL